LEDDADEESFQAAERFAAALAFGAFALEVVARRCVVAGLCDRDPVERGVELAVAAAVQAVALGAAGARLEWCDAAVAGELGVGAEAVDRADLGEQLGARDSGAAGQLEQRRRRLDRALFELLVELADRAIGWRIVATSSRASRTCSSCSRLASQRATRSSCVARSRRRSGTS